MACAQIIKVQSYFTFTTIMVDGPNMSWFTYLNYSHNTLHIRRSQNFIRCQICLRDMCYPDSLSHTDIFLPLQLSNHFTKLKHV
jgi:hypothetical protein